MSFSPDPLQVLLLWKMIFMKYEPTFSDMKPKLSPQRRDALQDAGLIKYEKRQKKSKTKMTSVTQVVLTDKAWDWAVQNLDAKISDTSTQSGPVLQSLLFHLKTFTQQKNISLYEFLHPQSDDGEVETPPRPTGQLTPDDIASRIRSTYFQFTGNQTHIRMRLAQLRNTLSEIPRDALDETLRQLKRTEKIFLYPFDDPKEITPQDEEAALTEAGRINHVLLFEA